MSLRAEWKCDTCGFSEMGKNMFASPPGNWTAINVKRWPREQLEKEGHITKGDKEEYYHCHNDECTAKFVKGMNLWDVCQIQLHRYGKAKD